MASPADLMAVGMPFSTAALVGFGIQSVTAAGTVVGTAAPINGDTGVALINGQSSKTGAQLSANTSMCSPVFIFGTGAVAPVIYMPTGHTINNGASSLTLSGAIAGAIVMRVSATQWYSIPLAP
jgi:hypothetical protein